MSTDRPTRLTDMADAGMFRHLADPVSDVRGCSGLHDHRFAGAEGEDVAYAKQVLADAGVWVPNFDDLN